ncbi:MAG TPA: UvrD-helicase domain-containing protein [Bacteroidota bacterium]|nr:UvrD-helicase domain-containing protein [Bacteroidota bacterium]
MSVLNSLNPVQRSAAETLAGPVMIVAGAGSGKTRVLTYRIAHLLETGVKPYEILALTFTNKAAKEMKERIMKIVGPEAHSIWAGTFHSVFSRILRHECEAIGYQRTFSIYDQDDSLNVVKAALNALNISAQQIAPRAVQSRISGAKNQLITPKQYDAIAKDFFEQHVAKVYAIYQQKLFKSNAMDFDDLLIKPIDLFQRFPHVLEKYQYRFKYLLVDEYQDTNHAQYVLIKLLADRFKNICVVGDDAQSIYAFRGADIRNILDFERDYPQSKTFRLEQNYRSTKTIIAAADSVIKNNKQQIPKTLWTDNAKGDLITLNEAEDDKDEGLTIAHQIQDLCGREKLDLKNFAILYRTNAQSRSLEDALRRAGLTYVIVGGVEFYKRKEIKDVIAYLRLIVNPNDEESLKRVINFPTRGIGETTIEKLQAYSAFQQIALIEALQRVGEITTLSERTKNAVRAFTSFILKYRELQQTLSPGELARSMVDDLGILKAYKEEGTPESLARWENVQEALSAITEYMAQNENGTLEGFLEEVSLISAVDMAPDQRNAVTLMTIHAAKGLEFPVVFVTGMEEGLFPLYQTSPDPSELEEERRLFYVSITRSMQKLFLSHARIRYRFGDVTYPVISRFVEEVDQSLIERNVSRHYAGTQQYASGTQGAQRYDPYERKKTQYREQPKKQSTPTFDDGDIDYANQSQEEQQLRVGARVEHEVFGKGTIMQLSGKGEEAKATVNFAAAGRKQLMLKFAHLRLTS